MKKALPAGPGGLFIFPVPNRMRRNIMSKESTIEELSRLRVRYEMEGTDAVVIEEDVEYCSSPQPLIMNIYRPGGENQGSPGPAVILVAGYPFPAEFIRKWKPADSWARLIAASGITAIVYECSDPVTDTRTMLEFMRNNTETLSIDCHRLGLWSSSGNTPNALSLLMEKKYEYIRCAVCCYGYMLDCDGSTTVADAAAEYGFSNPCMNQSLLDVQVNVPLFIVRAGQDRFAGLNDTIDYFVTGALINNLPVTLVNHADGEHGFELYDDSMKSRHIVRHILEFLKLNLAEQAAGAC